MTYVSKSRCRLLEHLDCNLGYVLVLLWKKADSVNVAPFAARASTDRVEAEVMRNIKVVERV